MAGLLELGLSTEFLVVGLLTVVLSWWISYKWRRREIDRLGALIPGPPTLPIIGNTFDWFGEPLDILSKCEEYCAKYGSTFRAWLGPRLVITIFTPEDIEIVLKSSSALHKDPLYRFFKVAGDGLFSAPVEKWQVHRRLIAPAFNTKLLDGFMNVFNEKNKILLKKLEDEMGQGEFDIFEYIEPMNLDTICSEDVYFISYQTNDMFLLQWFNKEYRIAENAMGVDCEVQANPRNKLAHAVKRVQELMFGRLYKLWMHSDILYRLFGPKKEYDRMEKEIRKFASNVIQTRRAQSIIDTVSHLHGIPNGGNRNQKYFLDMLLELSDDGADFTDKDIIDEVVTMMIGGSDTSTMAMSFCLLALAMHPEIQEKVYDEVIEVLGDRDMTVDDCPKLIYLEMVIKETLRRFTIAPIVLRNNADTLQLTSYTLPPGCTIALAFMAMHNNEKLYPDPLKFDPERFSEENTKKRHPFSFLPFSGGPRGCIGTRYAMLTMKTTISNIIRTYRLETTCQLDDVRIKVDMISRSIDGYPVKIFKR